MSDFLLNSPVVIGEGGGGSFGAAGMYIDYCIPTAYRYSTAAASAAVAAAQAAGGGAAGGDFDFDPNVDPELAMVLRVSLSKDLLIHSILDAVDIHGRRARKATSRSSTKSRARHWSW